MKYKNIVVMDIDGCVLDPKERIQYYLDGDLERYGSLWHTDSIIEAGHAVYAMLLRNRDLRCLFVTSRMERFRTDTLIQLNGLFTATISSRQLLMRPSTCTKYEKDDAQIKPWLLENAGYDVEEVLLAFDDRQTVVDKWRSLGVTCYQTAVGPTSD